MPQFHSGLASEEARFELGGQAEWYWGVPATFQSLASPNSSISLPAVPEKRADISEATGYWNALHAILVYRLGWSRPDRGMRAWYEANRPTEDPTLALVEEIWGNDGWLDGYVAWLLTLQYKLLEDSSATTPWQQHPHDELSEPWREFVQRAEQRSSDNPHVAFTGGWDPFHLTMHGQEGEPGKYDIQVSNRPQRRAVFATPSATSWYSTLAAAGATLPKIGAQSWRVDVYVKSIGFMGTYRRSRLTGLWFTGKHSVHTTGN